MPDGTLMSINLMGGHGKLSEAELESVRTGTFGIFIGAKLPEKGRWDEWRKEHGESDKRYQNGNEKGA